MSDENDLTLRITHQGTVYQLALGDYTGEDDLLCYRATGFSVMEIFIESKITLFTMAALVWLHRRKTERTLTYEAVNSTMRMDDLTTVETDDTTDAEGKADPPA